MRTAWLCCGLWLLLGAGPARAQPTGNATESAAPPAAATQSDPAAEARAEAERLFAAGDTAGARAAWQRVLKLDPPAWDAVVGLAGCTLLNGDLASAERDFMRALSAAPEDSTLPALIGMAYQAAGKYETAAAYFSRALKLADRPRYHHLLAGALLELGQLAQARAEIAAALAAEPATPAWLKLAGDVELAAGADGAALAYYQQAAAAGDGYEYQLELARLLSDLGREEAEAAWQQLVDGWGDQAGAWLGRAWHHKAYGRYNAAVGDIEQALQVDPNSAAAHELWAQLLGEQDDTAGAAEHYRAALELEPTPERYTALLDLLEGDAARLAEWERLWSEFMAAYPSRPEALLANGDRLYQAGSYAAAAEAFARGALAAPQDPRFPRRGGDCRYSLGDYGAAAELYERALALGFDAAVVADLASAYQLGGQGEQAAQLWRRSLREHPDDPELAMQYGLELYAAGDYDGALEQYRRGQRLAPDDDRFFNRSAMCLFMLGRVAEAVDEVEQALRLRLDPQYFYNLAVGYEELKQPADAAQTYRDGLAVFPADRQLLEAYGEFLVGQGEFHTALEQLRVIAELEQSAAAYARLARLAQQAGDTGQADAAFQQALAYDPDDPDLRSEYALLLAALNRERELLELLQETRELLGAEAANQMLDELGGYWLDFSEYERGADFLNRVIAYDTRLSAAYNALAMLEHMQGRGEQALATVKRGLLDAGDNYFGRYLEADLTYLTYGAAAALPLARTLLEHPRADAAAFELYLEILDFNGEYEAQVEVARRGLAGFPDSVELLGYLARALYATGDSAAVIELLSGRHYSRLSWAPRYELLGLSYLDQGNYVKAVANLTVAAEDSQLAELWTALGEAQYLLGRGAEARSSLTRALALDPEEPAAHVWLGLVLTEQDDLEGAAASFAAVTEAGYLSETAAAWLVLGRAQLALSSGDRLGAQDLLVQARMYLPLSAEFNSRLEALSEEAGL